MAATVIAGFKWPPEIGAAMNNEVSKPNATANGTNALYVSLNVFEETKIDVIKINVPINSAIADWANEGILLVL